MRRAQMLLTESQHAELTALAERQGISLSALLRALVDRALSSAPDPEGRPWVRAISGLTDDGGLQDPDQDRLLYDDQASC